MPSTSNKQLLKKARTALNTMMGAQGNSGNGVLMSALDTYLNELMLQNDPDFYLDYLTQGKSCWQKVLGYCKT
jgi:hypothetical protein|tara:strand:+ start:4087 stop:4305 length:219 start_codon:yes stop_codon:yes gene_type:complete